MMLPRAANQLLLPVNPLFIALSLLLALGVNLLPLGRHPAQADLLALVLVFWGIHQPRMVGLGIAFLFGLLMDVHDAALLGEHALSYTLLSYGALAMHRRVPWFPLPGKMAHVLPLFLATQLVLLIVRMAAGGSFPGWTWFLQSFSGALLWPVAHWLLLAPQRRAVDRDENRPI